MTAYVATVKPTGQGGDFTRLYDACVYYGLLRVFGTVVTGGPSDTLVITLGGDWSAGHDTTDCNVESGSQPSTFGSVLIECDAANAFDGVYDPSKYVLIGPGESNYSVISFNSSGITLRGLQVSVTGGHTSNGGIISAINPGAEVTCENCYAFGSQYAPFAALFGGVFHAVNCLSYDSSDDAGFSGDSGTTTADHCIAVSCAYGFGGPYQSITATNCLAFNCGEDFKTGAFAATGDYNISEDASAPGANSIHGATYTFQAGTYFLDRTDTSGAIGGGTATVATDVVGADFASPPTIGFYAVEASKLTCVLLDAGGKGTNEPSTSTGSFSIVAGMLVEFDLWVDTYDSQTQPYLPSTITGLGLTFELVLAHAPVGWTNYYALLRYRAEAPADATGAITFTYAVDVDALAWSVKGWTGQAQGSNGANAYLQTLVTDDHTPVVLAAFGAPENRCSLMVTNESPPDLSITATVTAGLTPVSLSLGTDAEHNFQESLRTAVGAPGGALGGTADWSNTYGTGSQSSLASEIVASSAVAVPITNTPPAPVESAPSALATTSRSPTASSVSHSSLSVVAATPAGRAVSPSVLASTSRAPTPVAVAPASLAATSSAPSVLATQPSALAGTNQTPAARSVAPSAMAGTNHAPAGYAVAASTLALAHTSPNPYSTAPSAVAGTNHVPEPLSAGQSSLPLVSGRPTPSPVGPSFFTLTAYSPTPYSVRPSTLQSTVEPVLNVEPTVLDVPAPNFTCS